MVERHSRQGAPLCLLPGGALLWDASGCDRTWSEPWRASSCLSVTERRPVCGARRCARALPRPSHFLVLALPRGGVPVACEVAAALRAPLDVMIVRKLGVPWQEEVAMGAVASGGARLLNSEVVRSRTLQKPETPARARLR